MTATTYEGRPCRRCGKTVRRTANRACVACDRALKRTENMSLEQVERERQRSWRGKWERITAGRCANCGQPKLSEWYCWDCLNKKEAYYHEGGGWLKARKRDLASQRADTLRQLADLHTQAEAIKWGVG